MSQLQDNLEPVKEKASEVARDMGESLKPAAQEAAESVRATAQEGVESVKQEGQAAAHRRQRPGSGLQGNGATAAVWLSRRACEARWWIHSHGGANPPSSCCQRRESRADARGLRLQKTGGRRRTVLDTVPTPSLAGPYGMRRVTAVRSAPSGCELASRQGWCRPGRSPVTSPIQRRRCSQWSCGLGQERDRRRK